MDSDTDYSSGSDYYMEPQEPQEPDSEHPSIYEPNPEHPIYYEPEAYFVDVFIDGYHSTFRLPDNLQVGFATEEHTNPNAKMSLIVSANDLDELITRLNNLVIDQSNINIVYEPAF
jgi:hypothetical protein